jgi:hypothetical protein
LFRGTGYGNSPSGGLTISRNSPVETWREKTIEFMHMKNHLENSKKVAAKATKNACFRVTWNLEIWRKSRPAALSTPKLARLWQQLHLSLGRLQLRMLVSEWLGI